ncbi:MAG: SPOR domain-containing protein [Sphingobium sp.]|nr:SPOR domain-containing protein [Sphingobium sp.]
MMNRTFSTMMTSAVVLGSLMVGCSGGQDRPKLAANDTQSFAPKIERMLAERDYGQALTAAEQFVAADPQSAGARAVLGRAYLANGRFASARTAFTDAMTLGNRDPRTIVSLALVQSGLGDLEGAHSLLIDHISDLPAGDYGLAMTMAGDLREGVRALLEAVNAPDATAKTRQNLAYALALGGQWGQARLIAGQDLPAREAEARIGEWTQAFAKGGPPDRVIAMLGVSPRADDAGLPTQLALNTAPAAAPVQLASASDLVQNAAERADPAPVSAAAEVVAPVKVAEFKQAETKAAPPAVAQAAPAKAPAFTPTAIAAVLAKPPVAPIAITPDEPLETVDRKPASEPAPSALRAAFTPPASAPTLAVKPLAPATSQTLKRAFTQPNVTPKIAPTHAGSTASLGKPAVAGKASGWVVQLGAFDSAALAKTQWSKLSQSRAALKSYGAVHSTVQVNGRTFYRLAIRGFENRGAASATCGSLRTSGQDCFVRLDDKSNAPQASNAERGSGRVRVSR